MKTIHKYRLDFDSETQSIMMPRYSNTLTAQVQVEFGIVIWATVDDNNPIESRIFKILRTTHESKENFDQMIYLGTVKNPSNGIEHHVFEMRPAVRINFKEKVELINKIVINTYRQIAECGGITQDQAYDTVKELESYNVLDTACCPLCSETCCDRDCPFEDVRPDGGNPKYSKDYDK